MKREQYTFKPIVSARQKLLIVTLFMSFACFGAYANNVSAEVETSFLYHLSDFNGPIVYNWPNISVDAERNEIYVVDASARNVTVFNDQGMEIYHFGDDSNFGRPVTVSLDRDGNILVLAKKGSNAAIIKCNFRGEPIAEVVLTNFPPDFSGFSPSRMAYQQELLYLLDTTSLKIAVTDANGVFQNGYDLVTVAGIEDSKRDSIDIDGFSVDSKGNMLFTIPVKFAAFVLSPDGNIIRFGRPGGAPGRFNNIGGIVADDRGYYYVADKLKSAILIFDKDFRFQSEFGYRGSLPGNLKGPRDLALDTHGRLYVSQLGKGISVFQITYKSPDDAKP
jgi:DNA-binding beta-propeller fold protein YncE